MFQRGDDDLHEKLASRCLGRSFVSTVAERMKDSPPRQQHDGMLDDGLRRDVGQVLSSWPTLSGRPSGRELARTSGNPDGARWRIDG